MRHRWCDLRAAVHAVHGGVLHQQDVCGSARIYAAGDADVGFSLGGLRGGDGKGRGRQIPCERAGRTDSVHLQIDGQHDDLLPQADRRRLRDRGWGDRDLQRHDERFPVHDRAPRGDRRVLDVQNIELSGELPECGTVHFRHRLHGRRDLDGHARAVVRHRAGKPRGI